MTAAILSFAAPALPPTPPAPPAPATPQQADNGFAKMLSQRQAMAHEPSARHSEPVKSSDEGEAAQPAAQRSSNTQRSQSAERQPAKAEKARQPNAETKPAKTSDAPSAEEKTEAAKDSEPVDPALSDWLAALNLPVPAAPAEVAAGGARAQADDEADGHSGKPGTEIELTGGADKRAGKTEDEPTERLHAARDSRGKPDAVAAEKTASAGEWQAAMERLHAPVETPAKHETPSVAALGAAAPAAGAQRTEAAAAPVAVAVPTPVNTPEFAQSLGVQVSVLARDGIQQAELHLNPAEMGPISVQIALDGTQAQVNFGADSAATRQIIEGGLPELAAALRDAGFTLSGGGVHSQARGRDGEGSGSGDGSGRHGASSGEKEVTVQRSTARVSAGGVDLYA
ncbi:MAG TPA: flagellar hook-length control protein FliK [Rhizobacter sp.]|nr:flagellar hook-length control protein FliK [Rhizobacter sp.]